MTLKMKEIPSLKTVFDELKNQKINTKAAYRISKILTKIDSEVSFYQTRFKEILDEFAEKDDEGNFIPINDGQGVKIKPDRIKEAQEKLAELDELEADFGDLKLIKLDDLEGLEISIDQMQKLSKVIEE